MAFSDTEADNIRKYLGYAAGYYQYNTPLEGMIVKVGANTVEKASVVSILTELATVDTVLADSGATASMSGALKRVDDAEFYNVESSSSVGGLGALKRGRMLVERLRQRFAVDLAGDYFASYQSPPSMLSLG